MERRAQRIAGVWAASLMAVLGVVVGLKCGGCSLAAIGLMGAALWWRWNIWTMVEQRLS